MADLLTREVNSLTLWSWGLLCKTPLFVLTALIHIREPVWPSGMALGW